ncbi:MAG: pyridoxal phosphate-dependent aminotransferase [Peptoniphilaceae bacterium]|nr:pyridoxal phosphate-dependent aminotransferase [Peptoniphilaceae bacterium]MDY6086287.1 pyridoxal phosphate-dependent aminotransferase [Peptoniphilaceae bacterium]
MHLSHKMLALGSEPSVIRELAAYGDLRRPIVGAENVFDFSIGTPNLPTPAVVTERLQELLRGVDAFTLHSYSPAAGHPVVRQKIADVLAARHGIAARPDLLFMTNGATASMLYTLKALCEPGDEVIVLAPFFPEYRVYAASAEADLVVVPPDFETFDPDVDAFARALSPRTKAVILNLPNNPTGRIYSHEALEGMFAAMADAERRYGRPLYLVSDEPYRELVFDDPVPYFPALYPHTVISYSFSKSLSLSGERIGYIQVPETVEESEELMTAIAGAARASGHICASTLFQFLVADAMDWHTDAATYAKQSRAMAQGLRDVGYRVAEPQGAFYLFVQSPLSDAKAFSDLAKTRDVLVTPGDTFGVEGYLRVSTCQDLDVIQRSMPRFAALMEEVKAG